ncbi:hypothetical protein AB5N19_14200 [Seiridium cardinale]
MSHSRYTINSILNGASGPETAAPVAPATAKRKRTDDHGQGHPKMNRTSYHERPPHITQTIEASPGPPCSLPTEQVRTSSGDLWPVPCESPQSPRPTKDPYHNDGEDGLRDSDETQQLPAHDQESAISNTSLSGPKRGQSAASRRHPKRLQLNGEPVKVFLFWHEVEEDFVFHPEKLPPAGQESTQETLIPNGVRVIGWTNTLGFGRLYLGFRTVEGLCTWLDKTGDYFSFPSLTLASDDG